MHAIVVGAGIGGLTAAVALRGAGHDVTVLERGVELREIGAGLVIWVGALRMLDELGLGDRVREAGVPLRDGGALRTPRGRVLMRLPMDRFERRYGELGTGIHRRDLHRVLADALGRDAIRLGAECAAVEQHGDGAAALLASGARVEGDLVVGADGFNSPVARSVAGPLERSYAGYAVWRGIATGGTEVAGSSAWESWGAGTEFGGFPVAGGDWYVYAAAVRPEGEPDPPDGHGPDLLRTFGGWHEPIEELIRRAEPNGFHRNDLYDRTVPDRFDFGRVALLGDAAHPMRPHLGMGACQAIEDGCELGRCLAGASRPEEGLRAYSARRVRRARGMVRDSKPTGELIKLRRTPLPQLRDLAIGLTPDAIHGAIFARPVRPARPV